MSDPLVSVTRWTSTNKDGVRCEWVGLLASAYDAMRADLAKAVSEGKRWQNEADFDAQHAREAESALSDSQAQMAGYRAGLERVYHYWQERYGLDFGKADEPLMAEITRVQDCLAAHRDEGGGKP